MTDYKEWINYVTNGVLMTQMQPVESVDSSMNFEVVSSKTSFFNRLYMHQ